MLPHQNAFFSRVNFNGNDRSALRKSSVHQSFVRRDGRKGIVKSSFVLILILSLVVAVNAFNINAHATDVNSQSFMLEHWQPPG